MSQPMTRRGKITEEQVFDAAKRRVEEGKEVTPTALLAKIGSVSYTTIYKQWASLFSSVTVSI